MVLHADRGEYSLGPGRYLATEINDGFPWALSYDPHADHDEILARFDARQERMIGYASALELNHAMSRLVQGLGHRLPVAGARAAWVDDPRLGTRLFINVGLYSDDFPDTLTTLSFSSSRVPYGADLGMLSPRDLDKRMLLVESCDGNIAAGVYDIVEGRPPVQ